jgi:hypothetical protein
MFVQGRGRGPDSANQPTRGSARRANQRRRGPPARGHGRRPFPIHVGEPRARVAPGSAEAHPGRARHRVEHDLAHVRPAPYLALARAAGIPAAVAPLGPAGMVGLDTAPYAAAVTPSARTQGGRPAGRGDTGGHSRAIRPSTPAAPIRPTHAPRGYCGSRSGRPVDAAYYRSQLPPGSCLANGLFAITGRRAGARTATRTLLRRALVPRAKSGRADRRHRAVRALSPTSAGGKGAAPHPLVDLAWVHETYPELAAAGQEPLRLLSATAGEAHAAAASAAGAARNEISGARCRGFSRFPTCPGAHRFARADRLRDRGRAGRSGCPLARHLRYSPRANGGPPNLRFRDPRGEAAA